ncbi:MAG: DUF3857 domain-containing protein, partial [Mucilaginibacter sp.]
MNKLLPALLLSFVCFAAKAQTPAAAIPTTQPFGKIDNADLEMKTCDFEKDANAEVLFDKGSVYFGADLMSITNEIHRRIKVFNDHGKSEADVHIRYESGNHLEYITGLQAETINLVDGKQEIIKVDKKLIYTKTIDKNYSEITFTFPNVKPGSILEYKYNFNSNSYRYFPAWDFQDRIPVRYSEFYTSIPDVFYFRPASNLSMPLAKFKTTSDSRSMLDGGQSYQYSLENTLRALVNVPSLPDEPFMSSYRDNVQSINFQLVTIRPIGGFATSRSDTWAKVGGILADDEDFGGQLKRKVTGEEVIIAKAKAIKSTDERIAYLFNEVKSTMKWDGTDRWYTNDGTYRAWQNKTGNATEINLILYHLLKQSGIEVYPMVVSTR